MAATYEVIEAKTFSAVTSVTFSSIPQTYTDLVLIVSASAYYASPTYLTGGVRVGNGSVDTGSNYGGVYVYWDGNGTTGSSRSGSDTSIKYIDITGTPTDTGARGMWILDFNNYSNTTVYKSAMQRNIATQTSNTTDNARFAIQTWKSTSAINTIQILNVDGTNFYSSTATLYGIKAA